MTTQVRTVVPRFALHLAAIVVALLLLIPQPVAAGPLKGGIIGGIGGLAIGGIIGGGRGAAVGALVGGVGGAMVGAANQNRRQRQVYRPAAPRRQAARVAAASPLISGIQGALSAKGFNPGSIDGRMGPATAQAISAYQQANGLLVTGQPSEALLNHMQAPPASTSNTGQQGTTDNATTQ